MSRPHTIRLAVVAAATATSLIAAALLGGCTSEKLQEGADSAVIGTTIPSSADFPSDASDPAGPITAGTSPLLGMQGVTPGVTTTAAFRSGIRSIDPDITNVAAAAGGYDAMLVLAIATEVARIDAPGRIAAEIPDVTSKGRKCVTFARCRAAALRGIDLDYDGMTGAIEMLGNGDPGQATFAPVEYTKSGALRRGVPISAQAPQLAAAPAPANPVFGPAADGVLKVGTLLPVLGPDGDAARAALAGLQLAVREINGAQGVLGTPIELVPDESGDGTTGATNDAVGRLLTQNVDAIVGGTDYSITGAALAAVTGAGVILFSPTDTARALSVADDRGLFFRVAPPTNLEGQVLGTRLADQGFTRIAIATGSSNDDRDLAADIAASVNSSGASVTATVTVDLETDAGRGTLELLGGSPEAIVLTGDTTTTAALIRTLTAAGKGPASLPIYGTTTNMTPNLVVALGAS